MSLLLQNRDYADDGNGGVAVVQDGDELLGEVLFRLSARRGSFPFLPELGSRMHLLRRVKPSEQESLALQYAAEALEDLTDVTVTGASVRQEDGAFRVIVELLRQGTRLAVTARLEG